MLPDCIDDYITADNSIRVIEAYINSLDLAVLGCSRQQPNTTGRPMYDPKDVVKLYLYGWIHEPDTLIAAAGNGKQTKSGNALATAHPLI
jgi:transposase